MKWKSNSLYGTMAILKKIADSPGITAKELGGNSGVYRSLSKLTERGYIRFKRKAFGEFSQFGAKALFYITESGLEEIE
jgi:hypothetical protein